MLPATSGLTFVKQTAWLAPEYHHQLQSDELGRLIIRRCYKIVTNLNGKELDLHWFLRNHTL